MKGIDGLQLPMISGPEVITCDNTEYIVTRNDADRLGVLFSIPFYGFDDKLKGTVTAIIRSNTLRKLLPEKNYALINVDQAFVSRPHNGQELSSTQWVHQGKPDPGLIYSEVVPVSVHDPRSQWSIWVGYPDVMFFTGAEFRSIHFAEVAGYVVIGLLTLAGLVCWALIQRNLSLAHATSNILERRVAERTAEMRHMATHDALTGLPNRTLFREKLEDALTRVQLGEQIGVLCLDLDHFKNINDTLGHPIGDKLLKAVTARLRECESELEMVARFGGDEFVIIQTNLTHSNNAALLAGKIIEAIAEPYDIDGHQIIAGASIGIAVAPTDGEDAELLLRNADIALYKAKSEGRGTCRFFEPGMDAQLQARRRLELELRQALAKKELVLFYQPLIDVETERVTGFEALLRWDHPQRGLVPPSEFVPIAEETGLINSIGEWVIRQACLDASTWPSNIKVAVNLSPVQFKKMTLAHKVASALDDSGLLPSRLELEITESVLLANSKTTMELLHQLRVLGARIALDDFGTGYASLSYLRSFPFDKIKIDRSFIHELDEVKDCSAIVKAVASLGASLGIQTSAEGIETIEQFNRVKKQGCVEVQGFYFGLPRRMEEIEILQGKAAISAA
jgi:diguanylate cyclase (GGDEF)-like protein